MINTLRQATSEMGLGYGYGVAVGYTFQATALEDLPLIKHNTLNISH